MAEILNNPEKTVAAAPVPQAFSPAQSEAYASSGSAFKLADSTATTLPLFVICPDGTVAGSATTKQEVIKLNLSCHGKG